MRRITYKQKFSLSGLLKMLVWGMVREVLHLFGKGLSFGFVLFLTLSTLSLLGRSMNVLGSSLKSGSVSQSQQTSVQAYGGARQMLPRVSGAVYPNGEYSPRPVKATDARDTIRESGYFVNAVQSFMHSLAGFSK